MRDCALDEASCWHALAVREMVLERDLHGHPTRVLGVVTRPTEPSDGHLHESQIAVQDLLDLHEQERQVTAYDIHDGFIQNVVGAQMALESVIARMASRESSERETLERIRELLSDAIHDARRVIGGLRAPHLDDARLGDAIRRFVDEQQADGGPQITFTCTLAEPRLSLVLETAVFRIVQEAIRNVRRHAACQQAMVRIVQQETTLLIEVEDDGAGFDVNAVPKGRFGLEGMRRRARILGERPPLKAVPARAHGCR